MAQKGFTNSTDLMVSATIHIRRGDNPENPAGEKTFDLNPGQSQTVPYGNEQDIYLNGVEVLSSNNGEARKSSWAVKTRRGGPIDNLLNTNSFVVIQQQGDGFSISGHN